jgi:hypothetical protein
MTEGEDLQDALAAHGIITHVIEDAGELFIITGDISHDDAVIATGVFAEHRTVR